MLNDNSLDNEKILVTGVSRVSGIGTAISKMLADSGALVAAHGFADYDKEMKYKDADSKPIENENIIHLTSSDLSVKGNPEKAVSEANIALNGLTGLVLNHAYSTNAPIGEWTAEHINMHLITNVTASMMMIQEFAKYAQNGGCITLFTSGQYLGPMIDEIAYAVSKEAIRGLCSQASAALADKNIRVNCINPGPNDTGYLEGDAYDEVAKCFPSGRWGKPEDAAKLVRFLHSKDAQWITGQTIASEGGFRR